MTIFSLHCPITHTSHPANLNFYGYDLSDKMKHGHVFTITVLKKLPEGSTSSIICIKSDNCLSKCKCKYVFKSYLSLAPEISKLIIAFYSTSGHGKGLVNAMSSFSVKYPFRMTVLLKYFLYGTSEDIFNYLNNYWFKWPTEKVLCHHSRWKWHPKKELERVLKH